jgi:hypothetical protein
MPPNRPLDTSHLAQLDFVYHQLQEVSRYLESRFPGHRITLLVREGLHQLATLRAELVATEE